MSDARGNRCQVLAVCAFLLLAVGLVFGQTVRYGFVVWDDAGCVSHNPWVVSGLTWKGVRWAFTNYQALIWAPLTWISHMCDCQIYGLNAGGHHLTNVLLHAATAVLLFLVLRQMTGRLWPSGLVAAVFAIHPLRVESVAWITERKDVLSGLFFVLTLAAYARYARHPFSWTRYLVVLAVFMLGLMAKPILVTLPFVLWLLDYWPLGRWGSDGDWLIFRPGHHAEHGRAEKCACPFTPPGSRRRLLLEKAPLAAAAIAFGSLTILAHGQGTLAINQPSALSWRLGVAILAYVGYLRMFFDPVGLALPYPPPSADLSPWVVGGAALLLLLITIIAVALRRKRPYLLVGWLWYLFMLAPVSGLVQFGFQAMGDRFTYLSQIGLCVALAWAVADSIVSRPYRRAAFGAAAASLLVVLMGCSWRQASFWRDSETLLNHTLECAPGNVWTYDGLGIVALQRGQMAEAADRFRAVIASKANFGPTRFTYLAVAHYNYGVILASQGRLDEAFQQFEQAVQWNPADPAAHNNLGHVLLMRGQLERGLSECREAIKIDPEFPEAHFNVGNVLLVRGQVDEAIQEYRLALKAKPAFAEAHDHLGMALAKRGQIDDAIAEYRLALESKPDCPAEVHNHFGLALAARGRFDEAAVQYREALVLRPHFVEARQNLYRALAATALQ